MDPKQRVGEAAMEWISDGMVVGLGTGSTARFFIEALGAAVSSGRLRGIRGVPTSNRSEALAREVGIAIVGFDAIERIDVTVDGADEIDPSLDLIKGLGGALLREKLVAQNTDRLIIIADSTKLVPCLGTRHPLPVEVTVFGHEASHRFLQSTGAVPTLRSNADGSAFITDNGNYIYDCRFTKIPDAVVLNAKLMDRAGVVESGLFIKMAHAAIIDDGQGTRTLRRA